MATVVAENPTYTGPNSSEGENKQMNKLPDLNPIQEEDENEQTSRPRSGATNPQQEELQLPPITAPRLRRDISTESLMEALGLADSGEKSLGLLLKNVRVEVKAALEELTTITTHDDNLEKQYKETVAENGQLQAALDRARKEVRHLKGQLSILQMTPSEIREERARTQQRERKRQELERQAQKAAKSQLMERGATVQVLTAAERARTVNAKGEYIDNQQMKMKSHHTRRSTYPTQGAKVRRVPPITLPVKAKVEPLPPPLFGCTCSECNAQQSLGALTLNRTLCQHQTANQITKSGQQVLLGDRIVLKGERLGTVCYIGRLDFDVADYIYIGIHLDLPVGNINGYLKGRRYFQCPPDHGVMVKASDIICVTGRKPLSGGTTVPRVRERLPSGFEISRSASKTSKVSAIGNGEEEEVSTPVPSAPPLSTTPHSQTSHESVESMSKRIQQLAQKSSKKAKELKRIHEELRLRDPPTPNPTKVTLDESVNLSGIPPVIPRPATPPPITPTTPHPTEPSRPATPTEQTLLDLLSERDLGATGFVTTNELSVILTQLSGVGGNPMTVAEVTELLARMGVASEEGVGIPYHSFVPHLAQVLDKRRVHYID